jgi:hypothetical protein
MAPSRRIPSSTLKRTVIVRSNLDATILMQAEPQHNLSTSTHPSIDTCIFAWTPSTDMPVIIKGDGTSVLRLRTHNKEQRP